MDWSQILGAGGLNEQQGQIDQQLADLLARRKAYQPSQNTTGAGSILGGIGDILWRKKFDTQEAALRGQRQDVGGKLAGARGMLADALTGASQPVQAPPDMIAAPGFDQASQERDQQQNLRHAQIAAMLSGDPTMAQYAQHAPGMALQQQHLEQGAQSFPLQQAMERQKLANEAPTEALGGLTPTQATAKSHLESVPKFSSDMFGRYDVRTGKAAPGGVGGSGPEGLLSPEAIDQSAALYLKTGQLPSFGRANPVIHGAIVKRAAELSGGADIGANRASYGADKGSLAKAQTQADAIESFENTALKNLDQFLATAHGVIDTGSPLLNAPIRSLSNKVMGDVNMTKFNTARQVAIQEISKVLGGAVSGGAVTEGQRHEVEGLIRGDASVAQIEAAANILKTDMANRKASVNAQLGVIRGRMSGKPVAEAAATSGAPTAPAPPATSARPRRTVNGETREWDGSKWVPIGQ